MPRKPRKPRITRQPISPALLSYLTTGTYDASCPDVLEMFLLRGNAEKLAAAWATHREDILPDYIAAHPGTRPWAWWEHDAPKEAVAGWDHARFNSAQRRQLGGVGTPLHEVSASWGGFDKGIPNSWVTTDLKAAGFDGEVIDPHDPPTFESEAAYLRRHRLLKPDERKHLAGHPELLDPEAVTVDEDERVSVTAGHEA